MACSGHGAMAAPARRRRRRSSATAHGGCGKQRRRQRRSRPTRWRSTELRDGVEMAHGDERRTPELRWREKRRRERERGLSLGALPAAAAREGDGGDDGAAPGGGTEQQRRWRLLTRRPIGLVARPARARSAAAWAGDAERRRRPGRGGTWARGLVSPGLRLKKERESWR
ncbi:hypothetical protein [Oryza sativa Japonica Group]|uniref:Uncharacterized protein n=1 Tax=Oryza sativa subsp. japonica TaxID=39947 RepID=Q9AWZ2_ORYSJ|nr:hypothetical protein [Oryza sativa Japonica Group]BAB92109.1 hypothetical protein [Oryza sativa Japonica Group]